MVMVPSTTTGVTKGPIVRADGLLKVRRRYVFKRKEQIREAMGGAEEGPESKRRRRKRRLRWVVSGHRGNPSEAILHFHTFPSPKT